MLSERVRNFLLFTQSGRREWRMWVRHFYRLVERAWLFMVAKTGTNTLGFFVWTLALTITGWLATVGGVYHKNRRQGIARPLSTAISDSWFSGMLVLVGVAFLVCIAWLFSIAVVIYQDHIALVNENVDLRSRIEIPATTLRVQGAIVGQNQHQVAIVQIWLAIDNFGEPTTLRNWQLVIRKADGSVLSGLHIVGQFPLKGALNLPFLDSEFQKPIATVSDMQGYVMFSLPNLSQAEFVDLHLDPAAVITVKATNVHNREISSSKNIKELWDGGHEITQSK